MIKWWKSRGFTDKLYVLNLAFTWLFTILSRLLMILQKKLLLANGVLELIVRRSWKQPDMITMQISEG